MLLISSALNLASRIGPTRFAHRLQLHRLSRWKNFEPEFYLLDRLVDPERASVDAGGHAGFYAGEAELRVPFKESSEMSGTGTLERGNGLQGSTNVHHVKCEVCRLDDIVQEPIGFIKIDVEGYELAVLEGARDILGKHRPIVLVESERGHNSLAPDSVFNFLAGLGYAGLFLVRGHPVALGAFCVDTYQRFFGPEGEGFDYVNNFIFLPGSQAP